MADEALEALSSSLGKREPDPAEKKPAVDKVKVEKQPDLHRSTFDVILFTVTVFTQARTNLEIIFSVSLEKTFTCEISSLLRKY